MGGDEPDSKKVKGSQDLQGMTSKQYLDTQVVPHLLPALNAVSTNRPSDPIQYLVSTTDCRANLTLKVSSLLQADYLLKSKNKLLDETDTTKTDS